MPRDESFISRKFREPLGTPDHEVWPKDRLDRLQHARVRHEAINPAQKKMCVDHETRTFSRDEIPQLLLILFGVSEESVTVFRSFLSFECPDRVEIASFSILFLLLCAQLGRLIFHVSSRLRHAPWLA